MPLDVQRCMMWSHAQNVNSVSLSTLNVVLLPTIRATRTGM
ncbi:hypothetical protein TSAR_001536 [Trichomalopsis sarcophagae]|uniref:Uncharacterized protein n=1 Tax=Trichomalopsis sarcophagae TaxID=543379 RepID=A0A232EHM7_9HYME|nr:hypothetical protein TSAR_001536 [Trichomalopsis sarcophagae]